MSRERFLKFFSYKKPYYDVWVNDVHWFINQQNTFLSLLQHIK